MAARKFPSENRADRRPKKDLGGLSMAQAMGVSDEPAMREGELCELERIIECASPEQFQQEISKVFRKMMVRGLREIPPPKSIKELQAIYDMFRKAEGIERADKGGGAVVGGFLPRVVGRRGLGTGVKTVVEYPKERVVTTEAEVVAPEPEVASGGEKTVDNGEESSEVASSDDEFEV